MNSLFLELTLVLVLAGVGAVIVNFFKQPSIVAYILAGLLLGPYGYYHLHQGDSLHSLAEVGVTLLLFMVGLELDLSHLKRIGKTAVIAGIGQVLFTASIGYGLSLLLGFSALSALYIAIALTFSSTIIVVKLLGEKKDLESLYGKIAIGIFLVQDFVAIIILVGLASFSGIASLDGHVSFYKLLGMIMVKGLAILYIIYLQSKYVFPRVLKYIGKSDELVLIFSLAWALGFAYLVSLPQIGFNIEIGGFLAGLALAKSAFHYEIGGKIKSLRDFFIIIFFIVLGSELMFDQIAGVSISAIILSLFVLIGNPFIVLTILSFMGYKPRTSFLVGVTVAQISEFSFILMAAGYKAGHVTSSDMGLVTLVGLVTFAVSSYMIKYADSIYSKLRTFLQIFNFKNGSAEIGIKDRSFKNHIVLVGGNRLGGRIIDALGRMPEPFIIVDFNPEVASEYLNSGYHVICGDISDPHIREVANVIDARMVISTVPDFTDNVSLVAAIRRKTKKTKIITVAHDEEEAAILYNEGANYVLLPHFVGGMHLSKILQEKKTFTRLNKLREHHLKTLGKH